MAKEKHAIPSNEEIRDQNPAADVDNPHNSLAEDQTRAGASDQNAGGASDWMIHIEDRPRGNPVKIFSYKELAEITKNFNQKFIIGRGAFGAVYKGIRQISLDNIPHFQVVAVKKLDGFSHHREREFLSEIILQSLLRHINIVSLIGFSAVRTQRLLVYGFMTLGSLDKHLFGPQADSDPLDWEMRMKIAAGTASGLNYLHNEASLCVIFRDLKTAKILLHNSFHPRLSDFGLAEFGPKPTAEYYATEVKSDVYDFGLVLLELITGRRHEEIIQEQGNIKLFNWLHPMKTDREKLFKVVDRRLEGKYESRSLCRAADVALMCIDKDPLKRPNMCDVVEEMNLAASEAKAS